MILFVLIICAANALTTDEEIFGPQPAGCNGFDSISQSGGPNGQAGKGLAAGGIQGLADVGKGVVTGETERYRGMAIKEGEKSMKYIWAAGTAAANFAGPLTGIGIGILTDYIFPDKTQEENLKKFGCVAKHMERMKNAIHQNAEDIATNANAIHKLGEDTANWFQDMGSHFSEHLFLKEWNGLKTLNDVLIDCMKADIGPDGLMQFESTTKMQEQENELALELFDLLASELNEDQRRSLKKEHAERRRLGDPDWDHDCLYDQTSENYKDLKTHMANMASGLELMQNMVSGGNCHIDLKPFFAMSTLAESMITAVTQFLLGAKMRGYLSIKEHRDEYFKMLLPNLGKMRSGFRDLNDKINNYRTIPNSECVNARGSRYPWQLALDRYSSTGAATSTTYTKKICNEHEWCLGFSTIKYGNWLVSDYSKVKSKGATTGWGTRVTIDGITANNYCSDCDGATFGGGRQAYRNDKYYCGSSGCNCFVKQPIAGYNTEQCKELKGANEYIVKIGDHIQSIDNVIRRVKSNHETWARSGKEERKRFEAPSKRWYHVLTRCPEDNTAVHSTMAEENYRPEDSTKGAIVGCTPTPGASRRRRKYGGRGGWGGGGRYGGGRYGGRRYGGGWGGRGRLRN